MTTSPSQTILIALGGNALSSPSGDGSFEEQQCAIKKSTKQIVEILKKGWRIVITHGNGPQIGRLLLQQEAAKEITPPLPLHVCGAMSQGQIGYMLQLGLEEQLDKAHLDLDIIAVLTRVLVDKNDPDFKYPSKPIGPYYSEEQAQELHETKGYTMNETGYGDKPYRRVVASPKPLEILEVDSIRDLVSTSHIVIACGGGGVPVIREDGLLKGIGAVIDKDLSSQNLANAIGASTLMILTDVDRVALHFNEPNQEEIEKLNFDEAKALYDQGEFPNGSMGPKILSAIQFLESGGERVIITSLERASESLEGSVGTQIVS